MYWINAAPAAESDGQVVYRRIDEPENDRALTELLHPLGLLLPQDTDDNVGAFQDGSLIGCGFRKGNLLQGLAVLPAFQGTGVSASLISRLVLMAGEQGIQHLNVITKPAAANLLRQLGFRMVATAEPYAVFMELGRGSVSQYAQQLRELSADKPGRSAAMVMNCNPFTRGHRYLIEQAARSASWVWIFVVQEDISVFPFEARMRMVQQGTADLKNVSVLPGGDYTISAMTFPAYFLKKDDLADAQGGLDAEIFGRIIAPALRVSRYCIGTEPANTTTRKYHDTLRRILPRYGVEVTEFARLCQQGVPISATAVRSALGAGDWQRLAELVPDAALRILRQIYTPELARRCRE